MNLFISGLFITRFGYERIVISKCLTGQTNLDIVLWLIYSFKVLEVINNKLIANFWYE